MRPVDKVPESRGGSRVRFLSLSNEAFGREYLAAARALHRSRE